MQEAEKENQSREVKDFIFSKEGLARSPLQRRTLQSIE
jgi:hypothetical protein